jgi:hypothetical protein
MAVWENFILTNAGLEPMTWATFALHSASTLLYSLTCPERSWYRKNVAVSWEN